MSASTKSILDFAINSPSQTILVATEPHIIHQMEKAAPDKAFIGVPGGDGNCNCNMCPYMALNTLEKLYVALRDLQPRIELSHESHGEGPHPAGADAGNGRPYGRAGGRRNAEDQRGLISPRFRAKSRIASVWRFDAGTGEWSIDASIARC